MSGFDQVLAEDRRLAMLRLLVEANGEANESVLYTGLEMLGHRTELTRANVRSDLKYLEERGLVTLSWFGDKVCIAKISERGVEVSEGRTRVEGVKKPKIGD
jgi:DNA-binding transcriptional ArsR family regulator